MIQIFYSFSAMTGHCTEVSLKLCCLAAIDVFDTSTGSGRNKAVCRYSCWNSFASLHEQKVIVIGCVLYKKVTHYALVAVLRQYSTGTWLLQDSQLGL